MTAANVGLIGQGHDRPSLNTWYFYFFDLLLIFCIWLIWASYPDLLVFDTHPDHVLFDRYVFCFFAGPFLYGLRIAMYVAMARKYREPMTLEIRIIQISAIAFVASLLIGIFAGDLWASAHGYKRCFKPADRSNDYLYVLKDIDCPARPTPEEYLHPPPRQP
ncbi:hypothetical protein UAJ10_08765 [Nitrospirillum sp. BR 11164]|uniref:hypothetical protein n=1 Tax=Nitrospirillum sp. BR 11164 TaxID=3104324 RepID=UPI002AFEB464|nr:hypothetical protein [Nitrospirillum sp. BR 11164]MEA1649110.1 hypothetical protein [Nitrospirillum sp. BR 11164]